MSKDICRQFILHNDFIPPEGCAHEWDYLAYGYIDGISVKEDIFQDSGMKLDELWKKSIATKKDLSKMESRQVIYGFRSEEEGEINTEQRFWEDRGKDTVYPFIFFVLLQFEGSEKENLSELLKNRTDLEKKFCEEGKRKAITYLTLENSDLLLIIRSSNYEEGAGVIDEFHRGDSFYETEKDAWNIKYSFTVPAIDMQFLNGGNTKNLARQKIHRAYVYVTENSLGDVDLLYEKLKSQLTQAGHPMSVSEGKQSILGYNDELIVLSDLPWNKFLELYKDNTGLLHPSCDDFKRNISSITTIIGYHQSGAWEKGKEAVEKIAPVPDTGGNQKKLEIQKCFFDLLWKKLEKLGGSGMHREVLENLFLSLHYLANSLSKFQNSYISENLFFPSAFPVYLLIELLDEIFLGEDYLDELDYYQEYTRFLNGLNAYAQNPVHSDRQFTQSMEFNVRTYNLPVKLNTFYNAFIFLVREILNTTDGENKHYYEFLTCPGVSSRMNVEELFIGQSENKRLFIVNIPENQAYHLKPMMVMLCHEIGHFVGREIRNRPDRTNCLTKALTRMIALHYRSHLEELAGEKYSAFWDEFETRLSERMAEKYQIYYDENYERQELKDPCDATRIAKIKKRLEDHSTIMARALHFAAEGILRDEQDYLFDAVLYEFYMDCYAEDYNKEKANEQARQLEKKIQKLSMRLLQTRSEYAGTMNIGEAIQELIYISKESLADMIAIMLLELDIEQYAMTILENAKEQGGALDEDDMVSTFLIRASLVADCMMRKYKESGHRTSFQWPDEWDFTEGSDLDMQYFIMKMIQFDKDYVNNTDQKLWERGEKNVGIMEYLCDGRLLRNILVYLLRCRDNCAAHIQKNGEAQQEIKGIYKKAESGTVIDTLQMVQDVVERYRRRIYTKMQDTTEYGKSENAKQNDRTNN